MNGSAMLARTASATRPRFSTTRFAGRSLRGYHPQSDREIFQPGITESLFDPSAYQSRIA